MVTKFKKIILQNEEELLKNFPVHKQSINQYIINIKKIRKDGNLVDFIKASFYKPKRKNKIQQIEDYKSKGYFSSYDILINLSDKIDFSDKLKVNDLIINDKYTSIDICCLANNFNLQKGMYINLESKIKPMVFIKADINKTVSKYKNEWIIEGKLLKYYFEDASDFKNLRPNKEIIDIINGISYANVHLFYRYSKNLEFTYAGRFEPISLDYDMESNKPYVLMRKYTTNSYFSESGYAKELKEVYLIENHKNIKTQSNKVVKRDYTLANIKNTKIGMDGENLVFNYEKKRLKDLGYSELSNRVEHVSLYDDSLGYDIKSFEVTNNQITEIFIEVKSTTSEGIGNFYITHNELNFIKNNINQAIIYRVYLLNSDNPKFIKINYAELMDLKLKPVLYLTQ